MLFPHYRKDVRTMQEYLITNLEEAAIEKHRICRTHCLDKWEAVDYETEAYSGVMLVAAQDAYPEEITIPLELHGWYKIYLGIMKLLNSDQMYTYFKLDSDLAFSGISTRADGLDGAEWASYEMANELFWKNAYLSADALHIMHPRSSCRELSAILWIRCVEMTPEEVDAHQKGLTEKGEYKFHAHIDTDFTGHDNVRTPDDALTIFQHLQGTDVTMCSFECSMDYSGFCDEANAIGYVGLHWADAARNRTFVNFHAMRDDAYNRIISYCEEIGVRLHAAMRMQLSSFQFPYSYPTFRMRFAEEHPEYFIQTREGRTVNVLSYAYPEVRDYAINMLVDLYKRGYPGLTLLWIRGNSFGFEQPVLDRIAEKYDGLDGRLLPMTDERLHGVWCEFMNDFICRLREALDTEAEKTGRPRCNLHSIAMYTPQLSKQMGLDIETWAKEGWMDGVTAGMYSVYEELDECMASDGSGLIDMEKYQAYVKKNYVLKRFYLMDTALMCQGIREYEAIGKQYGMETYYSLNWENQSPELYAQEAELFYRCGARGIFTWDTNGRVKYPPQWHMTSRLAHRETCQNFMQKYLALAKNYRVLKLGGNDISYICANWRG